MKKQGLKTWIAALAVTGLSLAMSAQAADYEKQFDVSAGGTLDLRTDVGSIKILTHNQSTAKVEVEIEGRDAEDFSVEASTSGNQLNVVGEMEGKKWSRRLNVEFTITLPENFNVEIDTSGGSISIADLTGNVDAQTSGGSIRVGSITGDVELDTSGGSIHTEDIYGALNAHTSGGSIKVRFAQQLTQDAVLNTSGGSITAYLIPDIQVDLDASTSGGRVKTDFDVNGRIKDRSIRGTINGGGPELKLHTSGGGVSVRSL
jgi:carbon monoxide dehydrogenase subunit G